MAAKAGGDDQSRVRRRLADHRHDIGRCVDIPGPALRHRQILQDRKQAFEFDQGAFDLLRVGDRGVAAVVLQGLLQTFRWNQSRGEIALKGLAEMEAEQVAIAPIIGQKELHVEQRFKR